jgi:putative oxidoreductase
MRSLFLFGRVIFGGYFVYNGINHFLNEKMMSQYAASKGVAAPDAAVTSSGALLAAGGLSVLAGVQPKRGLGAIIAFLVPVTLQMHRFWEETEPERRMNETINFGKNLALIGAALTMLQIAEPWPISVDEARADSEEMFIRLGGRDLRALPV